LGTQRSHQSTCTRVLCGLIALAACVWGACSHERAEHPGRDLVIILLDTVRPDHLGFYGYERETMPYLAKLATGGVVFERGFSTSSWTAPSTSSLFTGLYPTRHGIIEGLRAHRIRQREVSERGVSSLPLNRLPSDIELLTERLAKASYQTFGFGTNPNINTAIGFDRGFDHFRNEKPEEGGLAERLGPWRRELLASSRPTFLYLHLNDAHTPYDGRSPWYTSDDDELEDKRAAYTSEMSYIDDQLRRFSEGLGWEDEAVVILLSDHGEEFMEHGNNGHKGGLHQELNRVLFTIRAPGIAPGRMTVNVSLIDVLPTVLDLMGIEATDDVDGQSLGPLLRREPGAAEALEARTLFAHRGKREQHYREHWWSALRGDWKLIDDSGKRSLYDHQHDFYEQRDVAEANGEVLRELGEALDRFSADGVPLTGEFTNVEMDRRMLNELRELGYVEEGSEEPTPGTEPGSDEE
jgi:arylsulfatase A-like enzyme